MKPPLLSCCLVRALVPAAFTLAFASPLAAGPSTDLPSEWHVPLEQSTGFALVDKGTGQMRVATVNASNLAVFGPVIRTYLTDVTGAAAGFDDGGEQVALASPTRNRVLFAPVDGSPPATYFPVSAGPHTLSLLRQNLLAEDGLVVASRYAESLEGVELTYNANLLGGTVIEALDGFESLAAFQPVYLDPVATRQAVGTWNIGGTTLFLSLYDSGANLSGSQSDPVPVGTRLASNVIGNDGRLMVVGYVPGSASLQLVTINTGGGTPWQPVVPFPVDNAPWPVASVAAARGVLAPDGVLLTAADGSAAAYGRIVNLGTDLVIQQTFTASAGQTINGLVPVPGRGLIVLEGSGAASKSYRYLAWDGAAWVLKDSGSLPDLLPPQTDFATLLWYDAEPLVDLDANLLQLDIEPDWTNGAGPVPPTLTAEMYVNALTGLANPVAIAPPVPAGSAHVLTNQLLDTCSLAILRPNPTVFDPPLTVDPPSGSYESTVLLEAAVTDNNYEILYREDRPGSVWRTYDFAFGIGYSSTWLFYAKHLSTGENGPIVSRTYTFPAANLLDLDADKDTVPDFVEQYLGMSATGGSDTDVDLQSDLEEILDGNDPNDATSFEPAATRNPPFIGEGFLLAAEAFDTTTGRAAVGEAMQVRAMTGAVLGSANVRLFLAGPLLGQLGASLTVNTPVPQRHWAVLTSPRYFDLAPPVLTRDGREVFRLLQVPDIALPVVNPALAGNDLAADAQAWIAAAQAAYAAYEPVTAVTDIRPLDTAVAAIGEAAVYNALRLLDPAVQAALGVPQDIPADPGPPATPFIPGKTRFTLLGARDGDAERNPLTEEMIAALETSGLSFRNLLDLIETEINAGNANATALRTVTAAIYDHHVANSEALPLMPLPVDALRLLARGQPLPGDYDSAGISPAQVTGAQNAITAILAQLDSAYRPFAAITVAVGPPTIPGQPYGYTNTASLNPVALLDEFGEVFTLEQGLGLAHGTEISIQGYTDVTGPPGHEAIEPVAAVVMTIPQPSDTDTNANLLDDDWEEFFFGALGVVGPFDVHPVNGFTYLQLFLLGHDPRCDDPPGGVTPNLGTPAPDLVVLPNMNFGLQFEFPEEFFGLFEWGAEESGDLGNTDPWEAIPGATVQHLGGGLYVIDLGPVFSSFDMHFFRLTVTLL